MFYFAFCVIVVLSTFGLLSSYQRLVCCRIVTMFVLSSACYDVMLFVILLGRFICMIVI